MAPPADRQRRAVHPQCQNRQLVAKIDTGVGNAQRPAGVTWDNGLSTPAFVDIDADRIVDYAYAGDLYGNMWKFDLRDANPDELEGRLRYRLPKLPLFTATDASGKVQPITVRPEVTRGPDGAGMVVLFGTGKYLEACRRAVLAGAPAELLRNHRSQQRS